MTRHRLDLFSLLSGAVFVLVAVLALTDGFTLDVARWLWPTVLIGTGVAVLASVVTATRRRSAEPATVAEPAVDETLPPHHQRDELLDEARAEVEEHDVTTD